tara:strand:- start:63604 stop:63915 length:312 start_codon:yes stop_codon:yes gene_type:complete
MLNFKSVLLFAFCVGVSTGALAERPWPNLVFDCQVITTSGAQGLVGIQSFSLKEAETGALGLSAITLLGSHEPADRVVQCVEKGSGNSFSDSSFQAWVEDMDQ